jgi:deoxyribodipyrimidine photo-lyase
MSDAAPQGIFWFRRDLRLEDNHGLWAALSSGYIIRPIFIFDPLILDKLKKPQDLRVQFIWQTLSQIKGKLKALGSDLQTFYAPPIEVFKELVSKTPVKAVFTNTDYEPYARSRDEQVAELCRAHGVAFHSYKDQVIFHQDEILNDSGRPYTVYTPYKNKWLKHFADLKLKPFETEPLFKYFKKATKDHPLPTLESMGFKDTEIRFPEAKLAASILIRYAQDRDFPAREKGTSRLGIHLRFGTLSVRELARQSASVSTVWLSELIWREFFMQILWHFPQVETQSFRLEYDEIAWRDPDKEAAEDFLNWCEGKTGYPLVDAGMRELNQTGHMHNRVRMVVASFLTKHLLIHWYHGERYFAGKLLDFDLSANNGNWQWAAGSGCDAAPYFRVFNPQTQFEKFDPEAKYVKKWVPEWGGPGARKPIVDHVEARGRALLEYGKIVRKAKNLKRS